MLHSYITRDVHKYCARFVGPYEGRVLSMTLTVDQLAVFYLQYFPSASCVNPRQQWRHRDHCVPFLTEVDAMWGTFVPAYVGNFNVNWRNGSTHCWTLQKMEVSSQFHVPAALPQRKDPPFPTESWSCVYTRGSLDHLALRKIISTRGEASRYVPVVQPVKFIHQICHMRWKINLMSPTSQSRLNQSCSIGFRSYKVQG